MEIVLVGNTRRYDDAITNEIEHFVRNIEWAFQNVKEEAHACLYTHIELNLIQNKMRAGGWIRIHRICNKNRRIG